MAQYFIIFSNVDDLVIFQHIYHVIMDQAEFVKVGHGSSWVRSGSVWVVS